MKALLLCLVVMSTPGVAAPKDDPHALAQKEIAVFRSQDFDGMDTAIVHLAAMGEAIVPDLVKALDDKLPMVRSQTAAVIAKMGPVAKVSVPKLTLLLDDADLDVRWNSCKALAAIGAPAASAIPALHKLASTKIDPAARSRFKSDFDYNKYLRGTEMTQQEAKTAVDAIKADQAHHGTK